METSKYRITYPLNALEHIKALVIEIGLYIQMI